MRMDEGESESKDMQQKLARPEVTQTLADRLRGGFEVDSVPIWRNPQLLAFMSTLIGCRGFGGLWVSPMQR